MSIDSVVQFRHEKKNFILDGKPIIGKPEPEKIRIEIQGLTDAVKWPQECANCGRPVKMTDTLIETVSLEDTGAVKKAVAVAVKGIPYCEVCFPKIKNAQNIYSTQLIATFVIGVALSIFLIKIQGESDSPVIFCGMLIGISFAIGYGLSWLLAKLYAKVFMKDKIAEPVKGSLIEGAKAGGDKMVSLVLTIPNEGYAAKFAELNGIQ